MIFPFRLPVRLQFLSILIAFCLSSGMLHAQLREKYNGGNENNYINGISFITPSTGYVAFRTFIGFTTDSGKTFTPRYIDFTNTNYNGYFPNLTLGFEPIGVKAFSADSLFIYGDFLSEPGILFSANGGITWKLVYHRNYNMNAPVWSDGVTDMAFPGNGNTGFAVHHEGILRTTNRGQTWQTVLAAPNHQLAQLSFPNASTGYVAGDDRMYKTSNGGAAWTQISVPAGSNDVYYNSFCFLTPNIGYLMDNQNGRVLKTVNGGAGWTVQNDPDIKPAHGGKPHFVSESTGYVIRGYYFYKTIDHGEHWEPCKTLAVPNYEYGGYNTHFFYNEQIAWAGGENEYLAITTNGMPATIPQTYFRIDTTGVAATGNVNLVNHSKAGYQYTWYVNDQFLSHNYHASYTHLNSSSLDSVRLVVSNGTDSTTETQYQYFNIPPPPPVSTLSAFTPATASIGTIVTITGTHFTGVTAVSFGGVAATSFTVVSPTTIRAVVANGASGAVSVTTQYNTTTLPGFTYETLLKVNSFSPALGPVGTTITIFGSNFSATPVNNHVYFGATKATVLSSSATQMVVTVPAGATYQPISVTVDGRTAFSTLPFVVTFPNGGSITPAYFPYRVDSTMDTHGYNFVAGDLDLDGKPDVAMGIYSGNNRLTVYRNTGSNGTISFAPKLLLPLTPPINNGAFGKVLIADLNSDGKQDLVASDGTRICWFRNESTPGNMNFGSKIQVNNIYTPEYLEAADFDGDGRTDLFGLTPSGLSVFKNTTSAGVVTFQGAYGFQVGFDSYYGNVASGDLNGDGKPEILLMAIENHDWKLHIFRNTSNAGVISFSPMFIGSVNQFAQIAIGDMDRDGKPDIVMTSSNPVLSVMRNTGTGNNFSFASPVNFTLDVAARRMRLGDINGDGKVDIVIAKATSSADVRQITVFENASAPGSISFLPQVDMTPRIGTTDLQLADFDVDTKMEIATTGYFTSVTSPNYLTVLINEAGVSSEKICAATSTSFTSDRTGTVYQWQQNNGSGYIDIANSTVFSGAQSATLQLNAVPASMNNTLFRCVVDGVISKGFRLFVDPLLTPTVTISTAATAVCPGSSVSFTSTVTNEGTSPSYQWKVNGVNVGTNSPNFSTTTLNNNDQVSVVLTSNATCVTSATATSNGISITLNPVVNSSVSISASATTICPAEHVTFTATPVNGGATPVYQWKINGVNAGTNSPIFTSNAFTNNAQVTVEMASSLCASTSTVSSNAVTISVSPAPPAVAGADRSICRGTSTVIGVAASGHTYSWTSIPAGFTSSEANPSVSPTATTTYYLEVSDGGSCSRKDTVIITVYNSQPANAGTDKIYCAGSPLPAALGSVISVTGYVYTWTAAPGLLQTNGSQVPAMPSVTTTYHLTTTSPEGCISKDSAVVYVPQSTVAPTISPAGPVTFCAGGSLVSSVTTGNQWYRDGVAITGATVATYNATQTGNYTVKFGNTNCSSAMSAPVSVTIGSGAPTPVISASGPLSFCQGSNVVLTSTNASGYEWYKNGTLITGATDQTYTVTQTGNYAVKAGSGSCMTMSAAVSVTVNSIPSAPNVSANGSTSICPGGSVLLNSSAASGAQWYRDGVIITGATNGSYTATQAGSYTVIVTSNNCSSAPSSAIAVNVNAVIPAPVITAAGSPSFCAGGNVILNSSAANGNQWYKDGNIMTGQTGTSLTVTAAGTYTCKVVSGSCESAPSNALQAAVTPLPPAATVSAGGATSFCTGGNVVLTSGAASGNQWFRGIQPISGATGSTYTATQSGNYTVTVTQGGCTSFGANSITVTVNSIPATPTITQSGNSLVSSAPAGNQWYKDGIAIGGATAATYQPAASGIYTVKCTVNGCSSAESAAFSFVATAINSPVLDRSISIAPNPVQDLLLVKYNGVPGRFEITVTDLYGRIIAAGRFTDRWQLSVKTLAAGSYIVMVKNTRTGEHVQRLIVKQ